MDEPMTQFRAIPIEWGLSDDKYYKFLMWVSFKATFKGWLRCDALQVTFTMREAASKFQVSTSTISVWVNRAKSTGLLLPTNKSSREHGLGEVYNLGGEMLMTVKTTERQPNADRTPAEQPSDSGETVCDELANADRTLTERQPNVNKDYSPTPSPTTTSASRPRKRPGRVEVPPIPEEILSRLELLCTQWPKHFFNKEGEKVRYRNFTKPADIWEHFCTAWPSDDPAEMIECGFRHLKGDTEPQDEWSFGSPKQKHYIKAMKNFYGVTEKVWKEYR